MTVESNDQFFKYLTSGFDASDGFPIGFTFSDKRDIRVYAIPATPATVDHGDPELPPFELLVVDTDYSINLHSNSPLSTVTLTSRIVDDNTVTPAQLYSAIMVIRMTPLEQQTIFSPGADNAVNTGLSFDKVVRLLQEGAQLRVIDTVIDESTGTTPRYEFKKKVPLIAPARKESSESGSATTIADDHHYIAYDSFSRQFVFTDQVPHESIGLRHDDSLVNSPEGLTVAVDGATIEKTDGDGALRVKDEGIVEAKLGTDAVTTPKIKDSAVTTAKILDENVTTEKIATDAINPDKIADRAVRSEHLDNGAVINRTIRDGEITTAKLAEGAVSLSKLSGLVKFIYNSPLVTTGNPNNVIFNFENNPLGVGFIDLSSASNTPRNIRFDMDNVVVGGVY